MSDAEPGTPVRLGVELTPMQRGLLASQRRHLDAPHQNMAMLSHLDGPVDPQRLASAFAAVVARHDALRTRIDDLAGAATPSVIAPDEIAKTKVIQLDRTEAQTWAERRAALPIDLAVRPTDSVLIQHPDGTSSWYLAFHHIAIDATSAALVFAEVADTYHAATSEPVESGNDGGETRAAESYYRWYRQQRRQEPGPRAAKVDRYWNERPDASKIGRLYRAVTAPTPQSPRVEIPFETRLAAANRALDGDLRMLSAELGWTTLMMSATALYLHRLTGADTFAIGMPLHNRTTAEARTVIGPVMDVYGVDIAIEPGDTGRTLHKRVGRSILTTLRNAQLGRPAPADFDTIVNVIPNMGYGSFGPIPASTRWIHSGATDPSHLLRVQLTGYGDGPLQLALDCNQAAVGPDNIDRAPGHFLAALDSLLGDLDASIGAHTLVGADELDQILRWGTGAAAAEPAGPVIEQLRASVAARTDTVIEAADGTESLTGVELWQRVETVAAALADVGVQAGNRVAIELPRSIDAVVAIYAVMTLGASYVPLDPTQPRARLDSLAERAGAALTITADLLASVGGRSTPTLQRPSLDPSDEAYLLYTSGSTGEPKGVPITQWGLAGYVEFARTSYFEPEQSPVAALFTALTFDLTVTTLFAPLLAGGRLVIVDAEGPAAVAAIAERPDITWAKATPSHLDLLLRWLPSGHALRTLVVGGEAFTTRLARRLRNWNRDLVLFNEYGPTEAVVGCMIHRVSAADLTDTAGADVPIGVPAPGVRLVVLDPYRQPVPIGAVGELYISHAGVTPGYLDSPTAAESPFVELAGRRWYRSGDLVRLGSVDGEPGAEPLTLTYLGRADEQVKVGGIRLDPSEVELALAAHPSISVAAVRVWSPSPETTSVTHCVRCGLSSQVPGTTFDADGVCGVCHSYDRVKVQAADYFGTPDDLIAMRDRARTERTGRYDAVHLLSGGKDSTYALYRLVELGFEVLALTLDNGFISEGAKDNARRSAADLGIDHEFMSTPAMNEIFRDSLARFSNVCNGCYKTIYTLATNRAVEVGAPIIFTGLSRGQLFETRLIPQQFGRDRFDVDAIDRAVVEARRAYHRADDAPNRLLDTAVFERAENGETAGSDLFDRIAYVDVYRYLDVELAEMLDFLDASAPWVRPADTGRSTNCLINAAGIHTHLIEQGYHNYAEPYAWDVRLGHKTRTEALEELDDRDDLETVVEMLGQVGYEPRVRQILTAWVEVADGATMPEPAELRRHLAALLPAHAIPAAYMAVDQLPITTNGKLDTAALPAPERVHRPGPALYVAAKSDTERLVVEVWERLLRIEPISATDDFFELGGDSLLALEMIVEVGERLDLAVPEELAFANTTPRLLAEAIDAATPTGSNPTRTVGPQRRDQGVEPGFSAGELSLLFDHLDAPDDPRYNLCRLYRVDDPPSGAAFDPAPFDPAPFDPARFERALRTVIERHVPLHWTFSFPRRMLSTDDALAIEILTEPATAELLRKAAVEQQSEPFDLENGPLVRCRIQPIAEATGPPVAVSVALVFHHISIDATSFDLLWSELDRAYRNEALPTLPIDYADHAAWQSAQDRPEATAHWLSVNDGEPLPKPQWPAPAAGTMQNAGYHARPTALTRSMLAGANGGTPFAKALAAIATVVGRHTPATDTTHRVGLGIIGSTRDHATARDLIGYFINPLPIVFDLARADESLTEQATAAVRAALAHRTHPFSAMVADRRSHGLAALDLPILVALQESAPITIDDRPVSQEILGTGSSVAPVTFFVQFDGDDLSLAIEHQPNTLDPDQARQLLADIEHELRDAIGSTAPAAGIRPLHELVSQAGSVRADSPALIQRDTTITYGELADQVGQLGARLQAAGVGPGQLIGIDATRRPEFAVGALAVMACGAAYVPLDPDLPMARLAAIIQEATLSLLITTDPKSTLWSDLADALSGLDLMTAYAEEAPPADGDQPPTLQPPAFQPRAFQPRAFQPVEVDPSDTAYVLFTSGSTGTPKGVVVRHSNIAATTLARATYYPEPVGRFLVLSSFAFDSSAAGLYWALTQGGTVVLPDPGLHTEVVHLGDLIERQSITQLLALPSLYRLLLSENDPARLSTLRDAIVAGEPCPAAVVDQHAAALPDTRLHNEYGPTEAAVWSHAHTFTGVLEDEVPIGRPIPGAEHRIVDDELWIGGAGVAAGYLGLPGLTDERFVIADGKRWYRTGDRVRVLADGSLTFVGRIDDQVKIRGHRVEIGEVEHAVAQHPLVAAAAGALVPGRTGPVLAIWFEPASSEAAEPVSPTEVARHTATLLPEVMRPAHYVPVDALPTNANGKIDRSALVLPEPEPPPTDRPRPRRPAEQPAVVTTAEPATADAELDEPQVASTPVASSTVASSTVASNTVAEQLTPLWVQALGLDPSGSEPIGLDDNFFDLGGDSIVSIQIVARARRLGLDIAPRDVFEHQTIRALADHLAALGDLDTHAAPHDGVAERLRSPDDSDGAPVLLPIQHWLLEQDLPHLDHWAQYRWLDLADDVDLDRLETAARALAHAHPVLAHRVARVDGTWAITIGEPIIGVEHCVVEEGAAEGGEDDGEPNWQAFVDAVAGQLDLANGPTLRVATFTTANRRRALIVAHHFVVDGVSWGILLDDWAEAYRTGIAPEPGGDVARWARQLSADSLHASLREQYPLWHEMLPAVPHSATETVEADGRRATRTVSPATTTALRRTGHQSTLLAALAVAGRRVFGWSSLDTIVEGHGREAESVARLAGGLPLDLTRTVGWCTAHHPISVPFGASEVDSVVRRRVLDTIDAIPDRGIGFGVGRSLDPASGLAYRPLPRTVFGFLGRVDAPRGLDDVFVAAEPMTTSIHPDNPRFHELGLLAYVQDGSLHIEVDAGAQYTTDQLGALADAIVADLDAQAAMAPVTPAEISPALVGKRELVQLAPAALRRLTELLHAPRTTSPEDPGL